MASEGGRGCSEFARMRGGDGVGLEEMASGGWRIMVVEDEGGCGR